MDSRLELERKLFKVEKEKSDLERLLVRGEESITGLWNAETPLYSLKVADKRSAISKMPNGTLCQSWNKQCATTVSYGFVWRCFCRCSFQRPFMTKEQKHKEIGQLKQKCDYLKAQVRSYELREEDMAQVEAQHANTVQEWMTKVVCCQTASWHCFN
jgi:hypothetical protein